MVMVRGRSKDARPRSHFDVTVVVVASSWLEEELLTVASL